MRIIIGAPGNGAVLKEALKEKLAGDERVSALVDLSTPDITYPGISFQAGRAIAEGRADHHHDGAVEPPRRPTAGFHLHPA